ncbi:hypothetical protein AYO40_03510 [Planctomycetaceae bacterium SCGC AG-212-D15]|nr:hypothetical protein AYO40_03510 [Planctomycetaceae bacterium SCGC AG-212-D15]
MIFTNKKVEAEFKRVLKFRSGTFRRRGLLRIADMLGSDKGWKKVAEWANDKWPYGDDSNAWLYYCRGATDGNAVSLATANKLAKMGCGRCDNFGDSNGFTIEFGLQITDRETEFTDNAIGLALVALAKVWR